MGKPASDYAVLAGSGLFDINHYLIEAPDVARDGCDPLLHFCRFGCREGRRPNLYFDPAWYTSLYLNDEVQGVNALSHYIRLGERSGLRPVSYFDPHWYTRFYGLPPWASPLRHYLVHRRSQRYSPNSLFDLGYYLSRYSAEIGPNRDAFAHLLRHGAERDLDCSENFISQTYRTEHSLSYDPDLSTLQAHQTCIPLVHSLDRQARNDWSKKSVV